MRVEIEAQELRQEKVCPAVARGGDRNRHRLILRPPHFRGASSTLMCGTCSAVPVSVHYVEVDEETATSIAIALAKEQEG